MRNELLLEVVSERRRQLVRDVVPGQSGHPARQGSCHSVLRTRATVHRTTNRQPRMHSLESRIWISAGRLVTFRGQAALWSASAVRHCFALHRANADQVSRAACLRTRHRAIARQYRLPTGLRWRLHSQGHWRATCLCAGRSSRLAWRQCKSVQSFRYCFSSDVRCSLARTPPMTSAT